MPITATLLKSRSQDGRDECQQNEHVSGNWLPLDIWVPYRMSCLELRTLSKKIANVDYVRSWS